MRSRVINAKSRVLRIFGAAWGQIVVALVAFAGIRLYTELLGTQGYGIAALAQGAISLLDSVGILALNQTLLSQCGPESDQEKRRKLSIGLSWHFAKRAAVASFSVTAVGVSIGLVLGMSLEWIFLPLMVGAYVISESAKVSKLSLLVLDLKYSTYSAWLAAEALIVLTTTAVLLSLVQPTPFLFVLGYIAGRIVSTLTMIAATGVQHLKNLWTTRVEAELLHESYRYGAPVAALGPLGWISTYLDRFILGALLGPSATGVYVAATGLVSRPYALTTSVLTNYFRPQYFQSEARDQERRRDDHRKILSRWILAAAAIGTIGALMFFSLADIITTVALANEFRDGAPALMVLFAVSQTFTVMTHAADNAVLASRQSGRLLRLQTATSIVTLTAIPIGVVFGGAVGGTAARCIAESAKFVVVLRFARKQSLVDRSLSGPELGENP